MKRLLLSLLLMSFMAEPLLAVDSLSVVLKFRDDNNVSSKDLLIGIHKDATHNIDTAIGEKMLPEQPPPGDIYVILFITDSSDMSRYHSYVDFRPIPEEDQFTRYHRFKAYNLVTSYTISWSKIGNYIDSVYLRDIINGSIVNVDMKLNDSFYVEDWGKDQFNIVVYYNKNFIDVNENNNINVKECIVLFPNPVTEELKFICEWSKKRYKLLNSLGVELIKGETVNEMNSIDMKSYSKGLYFLAIEGQNGGQIIEKIIKY